METGPTGTSKTALALKGTLLLLIFLVSCHTTRKFPTVRRAAAQAPPVPKEQALSLRLPKTSTNTYYFAATSYAASGESDLSPALKWTVVVTNGHGLNVTLAWDYVVGQKVTGYKIYEGIVSNQWSNVWDAGNTNEFTVTLIAGPAPLTRYLRLSWVGTHIWQTPDLTQPWVLISPPSNSFTITNPPGHAYWKATNLVQTNWAAP